MAPRESHLQRCILLPLLTESWAIRDRPFVGTELAVPLRRCPGVPFDIFPDPDPDGRKPRGGNASQSAHPSRGLLRIGLLETWSVAVGQGRTLVSGVFWGLQLKSSSSNWDELRLGPKKAHLHQAKFPEGAGTLIPNQSVVAFERRGSNGIVKPRPKLRLWHLRRTFSAPLPCSFSLSPIFAFGKRRLVYHKLSPTERYSQPQAWRPRSNHFSPAWEVRFNSGPDAHFARSPAEEENQPGLASRSPCRGQAAQWLVVLLGLTEYRLGNLFSGLWFAMPCRSCANRDGPYLVPSQQRIFSAATSLQERPKATTTAW